MEQTWSDVALQCVSILLTLISSLGIPALVFIIKKYLAQKINKEEQKELLAAMNIALDRADEILCDAVRMTNQTYVDTLKAQGAFDAEAKKVAFEKTKIAVLSLLNDEMKQAVIDTFGNLETWLTTKIESQVRTEGKAA